MKIRIKRNQIILILIDILTINFSFFMAYYFRYGTTTLKYMNKSFAMAMLTATPIFLFFFIVFKLYKIIWKYAGFKEYLFGMFANVGAGVVFLFIQIFTRDVFFPMVVLGTILTLVGTMGVRSAHKTLIYVFAWIKARKENDGRVMVIGAGEGGVIAINEMRRNKSEKLYPVCAIDDDPAKIGTYISGIKVLGDISSIPKHAKEQNIDIILIAIPSLSLKKKKEVIDICKSTSCAVKTMPNYYNMIDNTSGSIINIRDINPEELLARNDIKIDEEKLKLLYSGKRILVTGGAGTVGSSISKQIMRYEPEELIILDINERRLKSFCAEMKSTFSGKNIKCLVATIKDSNNINNVFMRHKPQIVFHCASHSMEDFMKESLGETLRNNIYGTLNVANAANKNKVENFIFISSDKAANPVNILGATKRINEMLIQSMDKTSQTKFSSIRFGNIIESTGEYPKRFKRELEHCGPLTVENKELSRYFMTISEATCLILESASLSEGGEIFNLDMGEPVRIYDLAKDYIRLSGYEPDLEVEIKITGTVKNGAIHEEVFTDPEGVNPTTNERISVVRSVFDNLPELIRKLNDLSLILDKGNNELVADQVIQTVRELVPNFYYLAFEDVLTKEDKLIKKALAGMDQKKIFLSSPHMGGMERIFVEQAFDTNWLAPLGPNVDEFENEIQDYVDTKAAVAMTTGTAAIHMSLRSLGVSKGDVVFCSSLTFAGSCNPIVYEMAIPVFIDSETKSWNMSPIALRKAMEAYKEKNKLPKAVIVVNLYGQSADYDEIQEICDEYNVPIIEDAAESLGATYKGKNSGTIGKYGIFSFNGNKIITTSGGGMLVSNDETKIRKVKFYITQARDQARHYQHSELGFNYRMSNVVAGIGRGQLKVLNTRVKQKQDIYEFYKKEFINIPDIEMMPIADFGTPNYWLSVITLKQNSKVKPLDILIALEKEFIESRPVWKPMNLQPFFMEYDFFNHNDEGISVGEDLFNRGVCLPSDTKMTIEDLNRVVRIVKGCWEKSEEKEGTSTFL